jgi:hypothetical protein
MPCTGEQGLKFQVSIFKFTLSPKKNFNELMCNFTGREEVKITLLQAIEASRVARG